MTTTLEETKTTHWFTIQSKEVDGDTWKDWSSDTDPAELLREFVNAVSSEEIDDANRYWRVVDGNDLELCDNCGNTVVEGDGFFVYSGLPFDTDAVDKGESGLVCKGCNQELQQEAEAA